MQQKAYEFGPQVRRNNPAFPARWFSGLYVLSPVNRALLPPSPAGCFACELDPSIGRSGPHDFAVRTGITRQLMPTRPSHPAPNARDDREAPLLVGCGMREGKPHISEKRKINILAIGLEISDRFESTYKIGFSPPPIFAA
jgi:hypothetical protein